MSILQLSQLSVVKDLVLKNSIEETSNLIAELRSQGFDVNTKFSDGTSLFRLAILNDCPLTAAGLVMNGINVNEMVSISNMGQYGILTLVIKKSYLNTTQPQRWRDVALMMINKYSAKITYTPVQEGEFEVDTDSPFYEALAAASKWYGSDRTLLEAILNKHPEYVNRVKVDQFHHLPQRTPLMFVILSGDVDLLFYLLQRPGIDINKAINYEGSGHYITALDWARKWKFIDKEHKEIFEILNLAVTGSR